MGRWNFLLFVLLLPLLTHSRPSLTPKEEEDLSRNDEDVGGTSRLGLLGPKEEAIFETFKHNLIRYHGVSPSFAEQFKINLRKAVELEIEELAKENLGRGEAEVGVGVGGPKVKPRQFGQFVEEDEDDEDVTLPTTAGPSGINIVNGIYGILTGLGSLNPDRVLTSTSNFFPPSQQKTADALIQSALGKNPGTWPTTTPTTTKPTTKDPDEDYDEDEDAKTTIKPAVVGAVASSVGVVPAAAAATSPPLISSALVTLSPGATALVQNAIG